MRRQIIAAALCWASMMTAWAAAPSPCDLRMSGTADLYHTEMSDWLKVGEFGKLEAAMEKKYAELLKEGNGDHLFDVVPVLNGVHAQRSQLLAQWQREMPKAFFANYVNGQYWLTESSNLRYGRPISAIRANEMKAIRSAQQKAREALALAQTAKPERAIVDASLILTDATDKGVEQTLAHLKRANTVAPKNISARLAAINYLDPRWGGSFEAMEEIVAQARAAGLPATHVAYLMMALENTKGSHFEIIEKDMAKAREHYQKAYAICNESEFAKSGLARTIGR